MGEKRSGDSVKQVPCPTCGQPVSWTPDALWRPFCSERCKLIDLGEWLDEGNRISEPVETDLSTYPDQH